MKKIVPIILALVILLSFAACGDGEQQSTTPDTTNIQQATEETDSEANERTQSSTDEENQPLIGGSDNSENEGTSSPQDIIEKAIRNRVEDKYTYSDIEKITINENLGTDTPDDYIALVYITWTQKNSGKTSKEVLNLYSDDLAATIAEQCENVQELAIFWTVPYLNNASAKCAYERKSDGMYVMDMVWGAEFNT